MSTNLMEPLNLIDDTVTENEQNPLENPVVLARLFELCELSDLYRFRLVSKQWYFLSLARFRREMTVVIGHPAFPWAYDGRYKKLTWSSVGDYLHVGGDMPFRNFRIVHIEFGLLSRSEEKGQNEASKLVHKNMTQFWGKHGSWIRKLELVYPQVRRRRGLKAFQKAIFEKTPNLEELRLTSWYNGNESQDGRREFKVQQPNLKRLVVTPSVFDVSLPILPWTFLLNHFPNVLSLEIPYFSCNQSSTIIHVDEIQDFLMEISQQLILREQAQFTIRELNLQMRGVEDVRTATRLLQLPLLTLPKLSFRFDYDSEQNIDEQRELLSTSFRIHGHTLEYLMISTSGELSFDNFPFQPGPFTTLTTLSLCGNSFKNLHFLQNFPKLQVLIVKSENDEIVEETDPGRMESIILHELTRLTLDLTDENFLLDMTMEMLVKSLPNVSRFNAWLSNRSLRVVCREWKQLRELSLANYGGEVDDEGITGIVAGSEERLPNITDLTELERLIILEGEGIGDSSIWSGILEVPSLKYIEVKLSPETSKEAYEALKEKFPNGFIICS